MQEEEFNAFFLSVLDFFLTCRKFCHGTAVDDIYLFRPKTQRGSCGIHCDVSAADNRNFSALHDRGDRIIQVGLHEIGTGEEFIGGIDALECFARNVHEVRQTCAGTDEYGFIAHFKQFIDGKGLADDDVGFDINTEFF